MTPGPAPVVAGDLAAVLWRLLDASSREDSAAFLGLLDDADGALAGSTEPRWTAWRHTLAARRALIENDPEAAAEAVAAFDPVTGEVVA